MASAKQVEQAEQDARDARARANQKVQELEDEFEQELKGNAADLARIRALLSQSEASNSTMEIALKRLTSDEEHHVEEVRMGKGSGVWWEVDWPRSPKWLGIVGNGEGASGQGQTGSRPPLLDHTPS